MHFGMHANKRTEEADKTYQQAQHNKLYQVPGPGRGDYRSRDGKRNTEREGGATVRCVCIIRRCTVSGNPKCALLASSFLAYTHSFTCSYTKIIYLVL